MNNAVLGKTIENVRKYRDIKLFTIEKRASYLVSKPSYLTTKVFTENLLAIEMKKQRCLIKPVHLWISILQLSEILMYEFWYYYVKSQYGGKDI